VLTAEGRVPYQALENRLLLLSHVRYAINGDIIWCPAVLRSAVAVKAADMCPLEVEAGGHVLIVMASATNGDDAGVNRLRDCKYG
jgi:hypothetical protein